MINVVDEKINKEHNKVLYPEVLDIQSVRFLNVRKCLGKETHDNLVIPKPWGY